MQIVQGPPPTIQLTSFSAAENIGSLTIGVTRSGDTSDSSTVNYATSDASGTNTCNCEWHCFFALRLSDHSRHTQFAAGETSKTISIPIIDDAYAEGNESFTITLSNPTGATLGTPSSATLTITDNETANGTNPIDQSGFFVRQHYVDFLNREPDADGLAFWTNQIT